MAKVGEGDPRWIVSNRKDGANVNSWHWEERDLSSHTHEALKKQFSDLMLSENTNGVQFIKIDEISEISGDVTVAQRKGKMMCYFELRCTFKWTGEADGSDEKVAGKLEVPEVDHDSFRDDYDVVVTCQDNSPTAQIVEDVVRKEGRRRVREVIAQYFNTLFEEYHIGQQLKSGTPMPPPPPPVAPKEDPAEKIASAGQNTSGTASISWKMRWGAPIEELFAAFTDPMRAGMYTRSPALIDAKPGGQFSFINGVISGYYVDLAAPTTIKAQWRLSKWPVGVHSSLVMRFVKEEPCVTVLEFAQVGIPTDELESVQEGWYANFFNGIKAMFGYTMQVI